ncbi:hypothetical protein ACFOVU_27825 [Nocardiopsis sediminis]|uniref:Uncharacterized protein n=1 Tax=Nocardiopsis sediminis TaxID=1778267 RepID=A0ABV8FX87_9ACTN
MGQAGPDAPAEKRASCYLLEFSVSPGGARQGDIHAYTDLKALREGFDERNGADPYLIMWYGALLHLWVVQNGEIVQGIDLHPFLRTGDERLDRTLARVLDGGRKEGDDDAWDELFSTVTEDFDWNPAAALPTLAHLYDLRDRAGAGDEAAKAEIHRLNEAVEDGDDLEEFAEAGPEGLELDWDAIAAAVPALREPLMGPGWLPVAWAKGVRKPRDSYLDIADELRLGFNDLENGDSEYLYDEDEDEG